MIRFIQTKETKHSLSESEISREPEQILHLKRLLVTLKQHYEKDLQVAHLQLQGEQNQRIKAEKELECLRLRMSENVKLHEEELSCLSLQQIQLKELLKTLQDNSNVQQSIHSPSENQKLGEELEKAQKKIQLLEQQVNSRLYVAEETPDHQLLQKMEESIRDKNYVQDKYDQLKDEWNELRERLEEAIEVRSRVEGHLTQIQSNAALQESQLQTYIQQLQTMDEECKKIESEREQFKQAFEETEAQLKTAQHHLAKKVKEVTLLNEKIFDHEHTLNHLTDTCEQQKMHLDQLQISLENYQKQEKRLQDQLHDQVEKYFRMCDKWEESSNQIRELKKIEDKHRQLQALVTNLGQFMGDNINSLPFVRPLEMEEPPFDAQFHHQPEEDEGQYNLFGMRQRH